jgi:ligand-binding SRPBCC domain-containing protein
VKVHTLQREQYLERPVSEVFAFFSAAQNLERLTPSWLRFEVVGPGPPEMRDGTVIEYRLRIHGVPLRWTSRIESWEQNARFVDRQIKGPYALWHHTHDFDAIGNGTLVRDTVRYSVGFGAIGEAVHAIQVQRDLDNIFDYRRSAVLEALA